MKFHPWLLVAVLTCASAAQAPDRLGGIRASIPIRRIFPADMPHYFTQSGLGVTLGHGGARAVACAFGLPLRLAGCHMSLSYSV